MQKEIGTKSKGYHRISVQEAYLYYGDYQSTEVHLEGSPFTLTDISYSVTHELPVGIPIYYRDTPEGLRTSNTITTYPYSSTDIPTITTSTATYKKIIQHGELYIVRDNNTYDILGRKHE